MEPLRAADGEGGRAARRGDGGWHAREGAGHEAALAGGAACKGQEDVWRCARRRQKQEGDLGKGTPSKLGEAGKRTPKPRAPLELALQEATQTTQALMKAMSTGQNIVDAVTNDATWQWARGDQTVEKACGCHEAGDKLHDRLRQVLRKRRHPDRERGVPRKAVAARAECLPHGHAQPRAGRGP